MGDQLRQHAAVTGDVGSSHLGVTRRTLLGATLASATAAATVTGRAQAAGPAARNGSARFAMITDTHIDVANPGRTRNLVQALGHIESRDPDFVLHCGDITDYGAEEDTELYRSSIPDSLVSRMHHVPGNHETQWNADAWEGYRQSFGPAHYSFDAAGLHVIAMDPLVSQQWPSYQFSQQLLDDIRADLAQVPADVPVVMFNHFPLGDSNQFVDNVDDWLRTIEGHRVRVAFAGHIHKLQVRKFNGLTQVVGDALMQEPVYYWAERITDDDGDRLAIHEVHVPATGEATEELIAEAPLDTPGPGEQFGPLKVAAEAESQSITVRASLEPAKWRGPSDGPSQVAARIFAQGIPPASWTDLGQQGRGPQWHGQLDATDLLPGAHRVQLRASADGQDPVWNAFAPVSIPAVTARVSWSHALPSGRVMAGLAHRDDLVVAATVDGDVEAFTAKADGARTVWHRKLDGGVYKAPVFSPDGATVLVGGTDHQLSALDAETGSIVWQRDLGAPVQCEIAVLDLADGPTIAVAAGSTLYTLGLDGSPRWQADLGGTFTGRACSDGSRVYAGSGDGQVHALTAESGKPMWATMVATKTDSGYHRTIYGPWAAPLDLLPSGDLLVPCHTIATALSAESGEVRWTVDGSHRLGFTRPVISEFGVLVFDGKDGTASLIDPATGQTTWTDDTTLPFVGGSSASWGSAPVSTGEPGQYWMVSTAGLLATIDLSRPDITTVLKVSNTYTTATPALVGDDLLVSVDSFGTVRGITGLGEARG